MMVTGWENLMDATVKDAELQEVPKLVTKTQVG